MKKLVILFTFILLVSCGYQSEDQNAAMENNEDLNESINDTETNLKIYNENSDFWEEYLEPEYNHHFDGLDISIPEIQFTFDHEGNDYIGVKVQMKNISHNSFVSYPGQMRITFDDGEQLNFFDLVAEFTEGESDLDEKSEEFNGFYVFKLITDLREYDGFDITWSNYRMIQDEMHSYYDVDYSTFIEW